MTLSSNSRADPNFHGPRSTSSGTATYYPCYDANGNISEYVDTNGVVVAHREYDPFGNSIVATGPMVNDFNFWFSTKYLDQETGLYYYGYRYYSPSLGRWPSRDPLGEIGFKNINCVYLFEYVKSIDMGDKKYVAYYEINYGKYGTRENMIPNSNELESWENKNSIINQFDELARQHITEIIPLYIIVDNKIRYEFKLEEKNAFAAGLSIRIAGSSRYKPHEYNYIINNVINKNDILGLICANNCFCAMPWGVGCPLTDSRTQCLDCNCSRTTGGSLDYPCMFAEY